MTLLTSLMVAVVLSGPEVQTAAGPLQGTSDAGMTVFRGVPYAAPPVGDLRWRPPQPHEAWNDMRDASSFGPACMQSGDAWPPWSPVAAVSEDCLTLNVWAPEGARSLPVMVWIHGGGWTAGSGSAAAYDGGALAGRGVVVVTLNYRLGPLGFMAHPDLTAEGGGSSGNYGLMDQVAALEWVRDNISVFGGDPARVTLFGQSAGAMSIALLNVAPRARGLFAGLIAESGGVFIPPAISSASAGFSLAGAEAEGVSFGQSLHAPTIAALRAISAEDIAQASGAHGFHFILDGRFVPEEPYAAYTAGRQSGVPILLGANAEEGLSFFDADEVTAANFQQGLEASLGALPPPLLAAYPARSDAEARSSRAAIERDLRFAYDMWKWTRLASHADNRVFAYRFAITPPWPEVSPWAKWGAGHGAEMAYVFGTLDPLWKWSAGDRQVAAMMAAYWTNFAKTGDPNGEGLPVWPVYSERARQVMWLSIEPKPVVEPGAAALEVLDGLFEGVR